MDVGDGGVELVADRDAEWSGVPQSLIDAIAGTTTPDELEAALRSSPSEVAARLLDARPAALVALAALGDGPRGETEGGSADAGAGLSGTEVLLVGTPWATLPAALEHLGARVTIVDDVYARLHAAALLRADAPRRGVHLEADAPLPFPDGAFATVFYDLRQSAGRRDQSDIRRRLAELARVAAPGAAIVIALRHPVFAAFDRHAGTGRAARLRAALAELRIRDLRAPWDPGLRDAGLRRQTLLVPARDFALLPRLMSPAAARRALRDLVPRDAHERVRHLAAGFGMVTALAPRAAVVAHRTGTTTTTLVERLVGENAEIIPRETWRVALMGPRGFVKLALSEGQDASVAKEVARTESGSRSPFAGAVPMPVSELRVGSAIAIQSPRITATSVTPRDLGRVIAQMLRSIPDWEYAPIRDTDLFARVRHPHLPGNVTEAGCDVLRDHFLRRGEMRLPVGPTHGDLLFENVLLDEEGKCHVVDWIRFEQRSPLLIDPLQAALSVHQRERRVDLSQAVAAFIDGEITGPLAVLADERSAVLDRAEAAAWLLLHEVTALQNPVDAPSADRLRRVARAITERTPSPPHT